MGGRGGALAAAVVVAVAIGMPGVAGPDAHDGPDVLDGDTLVVEVQLEAADAAGLEELVAVVADVSQDPRGWSAAGVVVVVAESAANRLGLAASSDMAEACAPWRPAGKYGCLPGRVGMINTGWWDAPPSWWEGSRESYRRRAVNHELGHFLGLRGHPPCGGPGAPLPVMALPPREGTDCAPHEWPVPADLAAL